MDKHPVIPKIVICFASCYDNRLPEDRNSRRKKITAAFWTSRNFIPAAATAPRFLQPAPSFALQLFPRPPDRLPTHPKMTTVTSYFSKSTNDKLIEKEIEFK